MRISDWSSDVCSSDLVDWRWVYWQILPLAAIAALLIGWGLPKDPIQTDRFPQANWPGMAFGVPAFALITVALDQGVRLDWFNSPLIVVSLVAGLTLLGRSEEHTSELQSLMRNSYAVSCLKKKNDWNIERHQN